MPLSTYNRKTVYKYESLHWPESNGARVQGRIKPVWGPKLEKREETGEKILAANFFDTSFDIFDHIASALKFT